MTTECAAKSTDFDFDHAISLIKGWIADDRKNGRHERAQRAEAVLRHQVLKDWDNKIKQERIEFDDAE